MVFHQSCVKQALVSFQRRQIAHCDYITIIDLLRTGAILMLFENLLVHVFIQIALETVLLPV
jgi:hypothetical protein